LCLLGPGDEKEFFVNFAEAARTYAYLREQRGGAVADEKAKVGWVNVRKI
jgi:hypothetical protein